MSKKYNLENQKFGKLVVLRRASNEDLIKYNISSNSKTTKWVCQCDCGNISIQATNSLLSGKRTMCWICSHYVSGYHKRKDYTGTRIGRLVITEMVYNDRDTVGKKRTKAKCLCDCGNIIIRDLCSLLRNKDSKFVSCGCAVHDRCIATHSKSIKGQRFGRLLVIEEIWKDSHYSKPMVRCICDCGNEVIKAKNDVQSGHTLSCGCLQKAKAGQANEVDYTGLVSDFGVTFLHKTKKNTTGQWLWACKCGICGNIFETIPARVLNNHMKSCGCKSTSFGEELVGKILLKHNINYIPQYSFDNCIDKGKLRFDFAIIKNEKVIAVIEYDGLQHYQSVDFFGGEEGLSARQRRDRIKDGFARQNNILMIRIPYFYTKKQIEEIITNTINA